MKTEMSPYEDETWCKPIKDCDKILYVECCRDCPEPKTEEFTFLGTMQEFKKFLPDLYERLVKKNKE